MEAPTQQCSVTLPWAWASQSCNEDMSVSARVHSTVAMSIGMCVYIHSLVQSHRHGTLQCLVTIVSLHFVLVIGV